jgi:2-amino-4-ketopentanoate thiolase alpha subunit
VGEGAQAEIGDWVEIERVVLRAGERSPAVPSDTAAVPYVARIRGFLSRGRDVGEPAEIRTVIGRRIEGVLHSVNPPFEHDFGRAVPELLPIGGELRELLGGPAGSGAPA